MTTERARALNVPLSPDTFDAAVKAAEKLHNIGPDGPGRWAGYVLQAELVRMQEAEDHSTNWWAEVVVDGRTVLVHDEKVTRLPSGLEGPELWTEIADRMLHHGWLVVAHTTDRAVVVRARTGVAIVGGTLVPYVVANAKRQSVQVGTFDEHGHPRTLLQMGKDALDLLYKAAAQDASLYSERHAGWRDGYMRPLLDTVRSWGES